VTIPISKSDRSLTLMAGPFRERVEGAYGMLLASELHELDHDFLLVCRDFGVPEMRDYESAISAIALETAVGNLVYIGCMGGIGRTGTVMAGLVRVLTDCNGEEAVTWVRANYLGHAVETKAQRELVASFNADRVRRMLELSAPVLFTRKTLFERVAGWLRP